MTFTNGPYPPPDHPLDNSVEYDVDYPFPLKQSVLTHGRHRWFQVYDIGTPTGPYSLSPGLTAGLTQRIMFDHRPDFIVVSISGQTANTGRVNVYYGEAGGPPIRLGPTGWVVVPAPENGVITLTNNGSTPTYGTVLAVAGFQLSNPFIGMFSGT